MFADVKVGELFNTTLDRYIKTELMWVIDGDTRRKVNAIALIHTPGKSSFFDDVSDGVIPMGRMRL